MNWYTPHLTADDCQQLNEHLAAGGKVRLTGKASPNDWSTVVRRGEGQFALSGEPNGFGGEGTILVRPDGERRPLVKMCIVTI